MNRITLTILSKLENARLVGLCAKEMAADSFDETELVEIEIAAVEAVNNCIEHACEGEDNHQILVEFLLREDRFSIELMDKGKAIDVGWLDSLDANFDFDSMDIENLPEGGMGLKLVKNCMDEVSYKNVNERNRWLLTKYRRKNPS